MTEREASIEEGCGDDAEKLGGLFIKCTSPGRAGVPDRLLVLPFCPVVFVEMKSPRGKPSVLQDHVMRQLMRRGAHVWLIDDREVFRRRMVEHLDSFNPKREGVACCRG